MPRRVKLDPSINPDWKKRAEEIRFHAAQLPYGTEKEHLLKQARQLETASHMMDWLTSPGVASPHE